MTIEATPRIDLGSAADDAEAALSELPWWRRPRKLRRQLAATMVLIVLASVTFIGGLNFVAARQLLDDGTKDQLVGVGEARARSIELGLERSLGGISAMAADLAIVGALEDFNEAFASLEDDRLEPAQVAELDGFYEDFVVGGINEAGLGPVTLEEVRPDGADAQYLQYHYTAVEPEGREEVSDPGDGSVYTEVHAERHQDLLALADSMAVDDLKLISVDGDVVYSTDKRIDFGTDLVTGPYREQ